MYCDVISCSMGTLFSVQPLMQPMVSPHVAGTFNPQRACAQQRLGFGRLAVGRKIVGSSDDLRCFVIRPGFHADFGSNLFTTLALLTP
jgi:hypothetical protein